MEKLSEKKLWFLAPEKSTIELLQNNRLIQDFLDEMTYDPVFTTSIKEFQMTGNDIAFVVIPTHKLPAEEPDRWRKLIFEDIAKSTNIYVIDDLQFKSRLEDGSLFSRVCRAIRNLGTG